MKYFWIYRSWKFVEKFSPCKLGFCVIIFLFFLLQSNWSNGTVFFFYFLFILFSCPDMLWMILYQLICLIIILRSIFYVHADPYMNVYDYLKFFVSIKIVFILWYQLLLCHFFFKWSEIRTNGLLFRFNLTVI